MIIIPFDTLLYIYFKLHVDYNIIFDDTKLLLYNYSVYICILLPYIKCIKYILEKSKIRFPFFRSYLCLISIKSTVESSNNSFNKMARNGGVVADTNLL